MTKPVILTGLRANSDLTLANYFGGMLPIIDMAKARSNEFQINMFIPDLHSFTTPIDHANLYDQILHNARLFVAAGLPLDNDDIHLYRQSFVPAHSELTWILDCFTGFGQMGRMTQFKDKSRTANKRFVNNIVTPGTVVESGESANELADNLDFSQTQDLVSVGLFNYPVLMAADILLYGASYIPVGDDQSQHLEFTRDIAERMNSRFGDLFVVPEAVTKQHEFFGKDQGLRIKDLIDPSKKMSKSDESGRGVIYLGDSPEDAKKKIMSATTDDKASVAYDPAEQPGISNLIQILALLQRKTVYDIAREHAGQSRYGEFKATVADEVAHFLTSFQQNLAQVSDEDLIRKLTSSEAMMNTQANETLLKVQQSVGLRSKV